MRMVYATLIALCMIYAHADTPPPGTVKAKTYTGDGTTAITSTGPAGALDVNVKNSSISITNSANGSPGSAGPSQATQIGGVDIGGVLRVLKASTTGVLSVDASGTTIPVSGTFWQATQPVSLASLPALAAGSNTIGNVNINGTVPVSGTVTATNPSVSATGSAVPASATMIGGSDGTNLRALKTSSSGVLSVDASGTTVPVSGTFWQATQPISAASLPLPSGAATSAKQPALGTAGTASSDVITVQGIASMTALKVDGSAVTQPISGSVSVSNFPATQPVSGTVTANAGTGTFTVDASGHTVPISAASLPLPSGAATDATVANVQGSASGGTAGSKSSLSGGVYNSSAPTLTTGQQASLQLNSSGGLKVDGSAVTQPVSGTVTANAGTGTMSIAGTVTANAGTGTMTVGQSSGSNLHVNVDSAPTTAVTQSGTWTVNSKPSPPTALTVKSAAVTIGTSAVRLTNDGSAPPSTRVLLVAQLNPSSTANCFFGPSTVTSSGATRGVQMLAGQIFSFNYDAGDYYAVCDASSQTFYITEQE